MTIQDLKNGKTFLYKQSNSAYQLEKSFDGGYFISKSGMYGEHVANVRSIGSKVIKAYTYIMDKRVNLTIDIRDCKEVTE